MWNNKLNQAGSALISALFIMTMVAIAATAMSTRLQLDIYRTRLGILSDKLYLASQAVSFWSLSQLKEKKNHTVSDSSGKILDFPKKLQTIYPELIVNGGLYDLQSRFNLNNLSDKKYAATFLKLLTKFPTKLNSSQREQLVLAINNWINPYQPGRGQDEFLNYYLHQKPPYYPGQQLLQHLSEFRLIKDVNAQLYIALANFLTVLPEVTPININTAPKEILASLGNGLKPSQINELLEARGDKGFQDVKELGPLLQKLNIRSEQVSIESQYFLSVAFVSGQELNLTVYTLFKRNKDKKGNITVSVLRESLNSP
ncbi:type II secretion system minor pseudopilin GspK [Legionella hackeliae]|uniref:Type II secretion system protein K n=1 Tax=Legionella hackeliae TaxID=449 RepID=A0A0A8UQ14_LEGHA|nr:type II secretion system minor pseudopilin GspK [Legionella hackeliae]KTD09819.1 type II secretory pathway protein [Legionella hackeliae]CEK10853.1 Type II secretory pathway protein [Legionella hackeliae]STX47589.1 general secretion pathway protein K [Legionella hackeliae]